MVPSHADAGWRALLAAAIAAAVSWGPVLAADRPGETPAPAVYAELPSEMPGKFVPAQGAWDYRLREAMIPMRDGVKLHTVILVPRGAAHAGILLTRTPYDASSMTSQGHSGHLGPAIAGYDNVADIVVADRYVRVVQDIRGKYDSEGDYVMNRPVHGPQNPTPVDEATDTFDTIDWLVKNVPESNGRVVTLGISYDGFEPLMALVNPHPALKAAVPMNPMVDGWMGDDWFHHGAFRAQNMAYIYEQVATRDNKLKWWSNFLDDYDLFLRGSAGEIGRQYGLEQIGFWNKILAHPSYDAFWSEQAVDRVLAAQALTVPVLLVHSLWDQEDIYGAPAIYRALHPKDPQGELVKLVMGPWHHGQEIEEASALGAIRFGADTGARFRREILRPFLARFLKDEAPAADIAPVTVFETGTNVWRRLDAWPPVCESGCPARSRPLFLQPGGKLGFAEPAGSPAYTEYVSDPARPVPFRARPIQPVGYDEHHSWPRWLVDDQREASGRTDVLTFTTDVLAEPVHIAGAPAVHLVASTSGTDSDWVVKLIDVYPDQVAEQAELGGYQLGIAMDIFRGRYRESFSAPAAIESGRPLPYRFDLPNADHVFLPGHRIMVQVQSSWFPLYDRNPQTFVANIFWAKPEDYRAATQRVFHARDAASYIALPVVGNQAPEGAAPRGAEGARGSVLRRAPEGRDHGPAAGSEE